jgi:hypothetical protein
VRIVQRAVEGPLRRIAQKAGWEGAVVFEKVVATKAPTALMPRPKNMRI